jgi:hypothetical protein
MNASPPSSDIDQLQKLLQVLYLTMGGGVLLFTVITLAITARTGSSFSEAHRSVIHTLSLAHLALGVASLPLGTRVFSMLLGAAPDRRMSADPPEDSLAFARKVQTAYLFRAATLEGVALFGLVICFLSGGISFFQEYPRYWFNLASPLLFVLFIAATFPRRDRLAELFRAYGYRGVDPPPT